MKGLQRVQFFAIWKPTSRKKRDLFTRKLHFFFLFKVFIICYGIVGNVEINDTNVDWSFSTIFHNIIKIYKILLYSSFCQFLDLKNHVWGILHRIFFFPVAKVMYLCKVCLFILSVFFKFCWWQFLFLIAAFFTQLMVWAEQHRHYGQIGFQMMFSPIIFLLNPGGVEVRNLVERRFNNQVTK